MARNLVVLAARTNLNVHDSIRTWPRIYSLEPMFATNRRIGAVRSDSLAG